MKESVWYDAAHDEIWVMQKRDYIIRGCQAIVETPDGIGVPDYLCFFQFHFKKSMWKYHKKMGWLVKLGNL